MKKSLIYIYIMMLFNICDAYMQNEKFDLYYVNSEFGLKLRYKPKIGNNFQLIQYVNVGLNKSLLQFGTGIEKDTKILKKDYTLSFEIASLDYTSLLEDSIFSKICFKRKKTCIGIGYLNLPKLYSKYTNNDYLPGKFMVLFLTGNYRRGYTLSKEMFFYCGLDIYYLGLNELQYTEEEISLYGIDPHEKYKDFTLIEYFGSEFEINPILGMKYEPSGKFKMEINYGIESSLFRISRSYRTPFIKYMYIEPKFIITTSPNYRCNISFLFPLDSMQYRNENIYFNIGVMLNSKNKLMLNSLYVYKTDDEKQLMLSVGSEVKGFNLSFYTNTEFNNREQFSNTSLGIRISYLENLLDPSINPEEYNVEIKDKFSEKALSEWGLSSAVLNKVSNISSNNFDVVVQQLETPDEVRAYTYVHFLYLNDEGQTPYSPQEIFANGGGDCDGQSRFQAYVLKQHGYESCVLTYSARNVFHGICIYKDKDTGKWNALEYDRIYNINASSIEELISKIEPAYFKYYINDPEDEYEGLNFTWSSTIKYIQKWFWEKDTIR